MSGEAVRRVGAGRGLLLLLLLLLVLLFCLLFLLPAGTHRRHRLHRLVRLDGQALDARPHVDEDEHGVRRAKGQAAKERVQREVGGAQLGRRRVKADDALLGRHLLVHVVKRLEVVVVQEKNGRVLRVLLKGHGERVGDVLAAAGEGGERSEQGQGVGGAQGTTRADEAAARQHRGTRAMRAAAHDARRGPGRLRPATRRARASTSGRAARGTCNQNEDGNGARGVGTGPRARSLAQRCTSCARPHEWSTTERSTSGCTITDECTPTKRWPPGAAAVAPESAAEPAAPLMVWLVRAELSSETSSSDAAGAREKSMGRSLWGWERCVAIDLNEWKRKLNMHAHERARVFHSRSESPSRDADSEIADFALNV